MPDGFIGTMPQALPPEVLFPNPYTSTVHVTLRDVGPASFKARGVTS